MGGLVQFGYDFELLIILITFIVGQLLESYFLTPKLVGEAVKLNPIWIIFALSFGGGFFGFIGILMAIPVAAIIGVIARFYFNYILDKVNEVALSLIDEFNDIKKFKKKFNFPVLI